MFNKSIMFNKDIMFNNDILFNMTEISSSSKYFMFIGSHATKNIIEIIFLNFSYNIFLYSEMCVKQTNISCHRDIMFSKNIIFSITEI